MNAKATRRARALAAGLSVFDMALGVLLLAGARPIVQLLGEQPGFSQTWGIGQLLGYAAVEAYAAIRPSSETMLAVAALRAVAAPADLTAARVSSGTLRRALRGVACLNVGATAAFIRAAAELRV